MKILLVILALFVGLIFTLPVYSAPYIYFNWEGTKGETTKIVLYGLPDSPIETDFTKVPNPADPADEQYYKADYDCAMLLDGSYTLTGKMKNMWGESEASNSFPFVKKLPGEVTNMGLGF